MSKKYKIINGIRHKVIGYTHNGKPLGYIACGPKDNIDKIIKNKS